ncbi:glycoside hydrolase family 3 protein [Maribacter aurantiacus]|uniref:beta-N-acetylhexosaminidase n=1 Tax=Maribacter aurantiacus TaxID=1882343 RepID=A0A5R8LY18_9FLAO|nr:glycoside hydrolase family 3 N-terminal domain-containing protein [Maribacter aurantiacus]TLF42247.1 glycoside hydrolase family 3 protein [Maribacter aurantiacus]
MKSLPNYTEAKNTLSTAEKIGQFFMPAAFINDTEEEIHALEDLIRNYGIGGICFFHSRASAATNFEGKKEVLRNEQSFDTLKSLIKRYQSASKYPLFIAIDAEWGLAMRVENTPQYPYAITLGAFTGKEELIYEVGKKIAQDCLAAGIHWNLSPVVDINNNPNNPVIGYRSFGDDREQVTQKALAYIKGTESVGILTSIKHFPGHGDTSVDSHLGIPVIDKSKKELLENELYPFQKIISEGVDAVMVGHLSVPALANGSDTPASISREICTDFLRGELHFKGVVISDALNMHAVSKIYPVPGELEWLAFNAGNDILCFAEHVKEGIETIAINSTAKQLEETFERVWKLKVKAMGNPFWKGFGELSDSSKLNKEIATESITVYHGTETDIKSFRKKDFCTLTLKRSQENALKEDILSFLEEAKQETKQEKNILLLVTPPKVKPANQFGFFQEEIDFINAMLEEKKVVLYYFGNPYSLNLFDVKKSVATVLVYQDFTEFQDVATEHFLGKIKAHGKLPVSLT